MKDFDGFLDELHGTDSSSSNSVTDTELECNVELDGQCDAQE